MATIIIGLGNPGKKFEKTKHNVGFMAVDLFAEKNDFPEFKLKKKSNALVSEGIIGNEKTCPERSRRVVLAKPQTFMNESGKAVKQLTRPYTLNPDSLIIVHDDIDLPLGEIKISKNRGSAGHKGVKSIIKELKTENFIRLRIGICPEQTCGPVHGSNKAEEVVLKKFTKKEGKIIDKAIEKTTEALDFLFNEGLDRAMNKYN